MFQEEEGRGRETLMFRTSSEWGGGGATSERRMVGLSYIQFLSLRSNIGQIRRRNETRHPPQTGSSWVGMDEHRLVDRRAAETVDFAGLPSIQSMPLEFRIA